MLPRLPPGGRDHMTVNTTVAIVGLAQPHGEMYLETLEALDEVVGVVLVEPDEAVRRAASTHTTKGRGSVSDLEAALAHPEVTHVLLALPNDRTPASLVQAIGAGQSEFTRTTRSRPPG